ncbi:NAD-dependent epimerase/dehydratase family protein [Faecalicatena sp. AGMB00832]|uniref:NAD-dependent epimerase/dehydratase family protein n=1 Tax=Faecalicatena faecalis TaxID=2726362 RepID=A0ABS6D6X0_9FIRM|nr:NAD-dependent epimerase/dehydratase family protein [Faecalicatena faecalis]MBU3877191.1 NAD-dependent epimerase/dehydratase family protein [Faecalicatena faecalis]
MKTILVTGGTVFISRYIAEYYVEKNYDVYVLNRNSKEQSRGVKLIQADRHDLGDVLRDYHFDIVIDTAYTSNDVEKLLDALGSYEDYILISSGAVYSENTMQPFKEDSLLAFNKYCGSYGTDKIDAEAALLQRNPNAYILRPPYLYGPMNNVYREAFVFDCALAGRKFYLPKDGEMRLQFFHVHDLCRFIDILLRYKPSQHIFNVGNRDTISIREWVELCYRIVGSQAEFEYVYGDMEQRKYFCFDNYEYYLDVSEQYKLMQEVKPMSAGLEESFEWYKSNTEKVNRTTYFDYIDKNMM